MNGQLLGQSFSLAVQHAPGRISTRGATQITRADKIRLMNRIDRCSFQRGILVAFGFITTGSPMRQLMPAENYVGGLKKAPSKAFFHPHQGYLLPSGLWAQKEHRCRQDLVSQ
jgi:hypothetical protein